MSDIKVGDRVVVESPVWFDPDLREKGRFHSEERSVGYEGVVTQIRTHRQDEGPTVWLGRGYGFAPEGLLRVEDLDRLAAERAPQRIHGYVVGSKVQLSSTFQWHDDEWGVTKDDDLGNYATSRAELVVSDTVPDLSADNLVLEWWVGHEIQSIFEALPESIVWSECPRVLEDDEPSTPIHHNVPTDEVRVVSETGAMKGSKLARFDLIPADALWELAEHYGKGSAKYGVEVGEVDNWRKGYHHSLSYAALLRHAVLALGGEDLDPETGSKHLIAVAWHALALAHYINTGLGVDDRQAVIEQNLA